MQHVHQIADHVKDQEVILICHQLAGARDTAKPNQAKLID